MSIINAFWKELFAPQTRVNTGRMDGWSDVCARTRIQSKSLTCQKSAMRKLCFSRWAVKPQMFTLAAREEFRPWKRTSKLDRRTGYGPLPSKLRRQFIKIGKTGIRAASANSTV